MTQTPSWLDLVSMFSSSRLTLLGEENKLYDKAATRNYYPSTSVDKYSLRLVFLSTVSEDYRNRTLDRRGRFLWARNLRYEGVDADGLRQISFTLDKGSKRFTVSESEVLCLPSRASVRSSSTKHNFNPPPLAYTSFSSVFEYDNALKQLHRKSGVADYETYVSTLTAASPFKPGTLVSPRLGYFLPKRSSFVGVASAATDQFFDEVPSLLSSANTRVEFLDTLTSALAFSDSLVYKTPIEIIKIIRAFGDWCSSSRGFEHPYGIVLSRNYQPHQRSTGKEFYRVNFGGTIYEKVMPIQMEVLK